MCYESLSRFFPIKLRLGLYNWLTQGDTFVTDETENVYKHCVPFVASIVGSVVHSMFYASAWLIVILTCIIMCISRKAAWSQFGKYYVPYMIYVDKKTPIQSILHAESWISHTIGKCVYNTTEKLIRISGDTNTQLT
jgi:type IV secretory pathway TrbF-like protein